MNRDWKLIRIMLLQMEDPEYSGGIENYSSEVLDFHLTLLFDAKLIHDQNWKIELTVKGKELLDVLRNPDTFLKAMEIIEQNGGAATEKVLIGLIEKQKG